MYLSKFKSLPQICSFSTMGSFKIKNKWHSYIQDKVHQGEKFRICCWLFRVLLSPRGWRSSTLLFLPWIAYAAYPHCSSWPHSTPVIPSLNIVLWYIPYSICWDLYCDWTVSSPVGFPGLWWHQDSAVSHNTLMPPKPITPETLTYYHIWLSSLATILDTNVSQFLCDDFEESDGNYKYFLEK